MQCPHCRKRTRDPECGLLVFVEGECPICLAHATPVVALPCGHVVCKRDFQALGGILPAASRAAGVRERETKGENESEPGAASGLHGADASHRSARARNHDADAPGVLAVCKGGHWAGPVARGCRNDACIGRSRCVAICARCPDRPENQQCVIQ
jgi:hypothetical protein